MQQTLPWIIALVAVALLVPLALLLKPQRRLAALPLLPNEWKLASRPVFSGNERRIYRQLREALPHHVVLSKLPLVRFCQPMDPQQVRFWYELLGASHVTFAICNENGRVLAAINLETERTASRRGLQIKQSVLTACHVRYWRCPVGHMPSVAELQLLVPDSVISPATRGPQAAPTLHQARDSLSNTVASRRRERTALAQDSGFFQDSFFAPDSRNDLGKPSRFNPSPTATSVQPSHTGKDSRLPRDDSSSIAGMTVNHPRFGPSRH